MNKSNLIELVRENPSLWDPQNAQYYIRDYRARKWNEVGHKLNFSGAEVKKTWLLLRDSFRRELRKVSTTKSGQAADVTKVEVKWPYFKKLLFLKDIILPKSCSTNIPDCEPVPHQPTDFDDEPMIESLEGALTFTAVGDTSTVTADTSHNWDVPPARKRFKDDLLDIEREKLKLIQERLKLKTGQNSEQDADYHFAMSIIPSLRKVHEDRKMGLRIKLMNVIENELQAGNQIPAASSHQYSLFHAESHHHPSSELLCGPSSQQSSCSAVSSQHSGIISPSTSSYKSPTNNYSCPSLVSPHTPDNSSNFMGSNITQNKPPSQENEQTT